MYVLSLFKNKNTIHFVVIKKLSVMGFRRVKDSSKF